MFSFFAPEVKSCNRPGEPGSESGKLSGCLVPTMNDYLEHRDNKIKASHQLASPCEPDFLDLAESKRQGYDFALPSEKRTQYDKLAYDAINAPLKDGHNKQSSDEVSKIADSVRQAFDQNQPSLEHLRDAFKNPNRDNAQSLVESVRSALADSPYTIAQSPAGEVWLGRKEPGKDVYELAMPVKEAACPKK